jgi:hypothetical protein
MTASPEDRACCMRVRVADGWSNNKNDKRTKKKDKQKKMNKERKKYNATSMNDISQHSTAQHSTAQNPGWVLTERTHRKGNTWRERGIDTYTSWLREGGKAAFASIESSELKKTFDNTYVNVSIWFFFTLLSLLVFFSYFLFFLCSLSAAAKWKHKHEHKHKHTNPAALDGNVIEKAFKKDYGQQINESVNF